jgi:hypothetical protein
MEAYHQHMSAHHESLGQWHESKGRSSSAQKEFDKAEGHHELSLKKSNQKNEGIDMLSFKYFQQALVEAKKKTKESSCQMELAHGEMLDKDEENGKEKKEMYVKEGEAPVAPVPGMRSKTHAIMVHPESKQRVTIPRKNIKNYPASEGWKEVAPGMKESVEELDELSKSTVRSYANKKSAELSHVPLMPFKRKPMSDRENRNADKGMMGALKRLNKEEVEELDEAAITHVVAKDKLASAQCIRFQMSAGVRQASSTTRCSFSRNVAQFAVLMPFQHLSKALDQYLYFANVTFDARTPGCEGGLLARDNLAVLKSHFQVQLQVAKSKRFLGVIIRVQPIFEATYFEDARGIVLILRFSAAGTPCLFLDVLYKC